VLIRLCLEAEQPTNVARLDSPEEDSSRLATAKFPTTSALYTALAALA